MAAVRAAWVVAAVPVLTVGMVSSLGTVAVGSTGASVGGDGSVTTGAGCAARGRGGVRCGRWGVMTARTPAVPVMMRTAAKNMGRRSLGSGAFRNRRNQSVTLMFLRAAHCFVVRLAGGPLHRRCFRDVRVTRRLRTHHRGSRRRFGGGLRWWLAVPLRRYVRYANQRTVRLRGLHPRRLSRSLW